ncbi:MAG: glycosyltransferase family 39 protein [Acidobacteriota bacterium]
MAEEITKDTGRCGSSMNRVVWILFVVFTIFTYLFGLSIPLLGPDEPRYAQVAREMFERHDWITPTLGGFPWFEKPALLYWLEAASYSVFGVSEFAARLGSALFGLGIVLALWVLGSFVAKQDARSAVGDLAKWLAFVGATTVGIIVFSRGASFDIILTFPITTALVGFFIADRSENRSGVSYYFPLASFYFFVGIALLAKGLVGIVFPFAIVAFYFFLSRRFPSGRFILSLFWGTLIWLAVATIWYVPVCLDNGYRFIDEFFIQHHFQRFTSNKYQHPQPFYFFFWVLLLMTIPWLPFFIAAIWKFAKRSLTDLLREKPEDQTNSSLTLFAVAWMLVPLVFFSFSGSKLPGYILPSVPAAIILTGEFVARFSANRPSWIKPLIVFAFATLIAVCFLSKTVVPRYAEDDSVKSMIASADKAGYATDKIFSLHTVSHNAEFYGAGRLIRNEDGTQRRFNGVPEIVEEMRGKGMTESLVIMPIAYTREMPIYEMIVPTVLSTNSEFAIVRFFLK